METTAASGWTCNLCGHEHGEPPRAFGREAESCQGCGSSVRFRALADLISTELFGAHLMLPDFPRIKAIRGLGLSDAPPLAGPLAEKFDYTNTFYHQEPKFDVAHPEERDLGQFDFVISSEVFEHVPPPVERSFAALQGMLKPQGLLLMTAPYFVEGATAEHFPNLGEHKLAEVGGLPVLLNRTPQGKLEVFEDLVFHHGHGSTLEMRRFTANSLRAMLEGAGFPSVHFASEDYVPFGIVHAETASLPIAARKEPRALPPPELMEEYRTARATARRFEQDIETLRRDFDEFVEFHHRAHEESKRELAARTEWGHNLQKQLDERTVWAKDLERDLNEHVEIAQRLERDFAERTAWAVKLADELRETRERLDRLNQSVWTRLGRRLRILR